MYLRGYLTQILAIILINTIHNLSGYNFEGKISSNRTSRLYNPIIQVVNFPNDPCIGSSTSLTGVCYSTDECSGISGGYADGTCAQGFGTCCVIRTSGCGGAITQNSTHIQNTGYPTGYTDSQSCTYTFKKSSLSICAIRLDYVEFVTRGPAVNTAPYTRCIYDYMTFTTPSSNAPPTLCGYNTGHHIYLDADRTSLTTNPTMTLTFTGTTFSRTWKIRVDQIPCGQSYTPPQGCMQYYMENTGNFKSFNFGLNDNDYHHLGTQDYSVCIRRNKKMCKIAYQASEDDGESFYTSQRPSTPAVRSRAGESACAADYINIPNGSNDEHGTGVCVINPTSDPTVPNLGRFCGRRLNCYTNSAANTIIYSSFVPFIVQVDFNGNENNADNKNRGFSVNYRQVLC